MSFYEPISPTSLSVLQYKYYRSKLLSVFYQQWTQPCFHPLYCDYKWNKRPMRGLFHQICLCFLSSKSKVNYNGSELGLAGLERFLGRNSRGQGVRATPWAQRVLEALLPWILPVRPLPQACSCLAQSLPISLSFSLIFPFSLIYDPFMSVCVSLLHLFQLLLYFSLSAFSTHWGRQ